MISTTIRRFYDPTFTVTSGNRRRLPDMQNGPASMTEGANVPIQKVCISDINLLLSFQLETGEITTLESAIEGYVGLQAGKKGINMSRIIRTFYRFKEDTFTPAKLEEILHAYKQDLESHFAFLKISFNYTMKQQSLRTGL